MGADTDTDAGARAGADQTGGGHGRDNRPEELLDMIWPETGLQVTSRAPRRPKDGLTEDDTIEVQIDFLTISLTPLEFIQLASFFRMTVDELLERHPGLQRAVVRAFDIRD